jgi:cytidylate kinase
MIITVDGLSGAGKGTICQHLSNTFKFKYLDTGLLYRFVAHMAKDLHIPHSDIDSITRLGKSFKEEDLMTIDTQLLRTEDIGLFASQIAIHTPLRDALLDYQRQFPLNNNDYFHGSILDGRDIGTVIFPNADLKFYVTASVESRAYRRLREAHLTLEHLDEIIEKIHERDHRDMNRSTDPLRKADGAIEIDTTNLSIEDACLTAEEYVSQFLSKRRVS